MSAHCIPKDINWLRGLVSSIEEDENIAGVYGRQEPMNFTPDNDKRDLFTVFGLDKKVQKKIVSFIMLTLLLERVVGNSSILMKK